MKIALIILSALIGFIIVRAIRKFALAGKYTAIYRAAINCPKSDISDFAQTTHDRIDANYKGDYEPRYHKIEQICGKEIKSMLGLSLLDINKITLMHK